ncbi:MAG TPA: protocatechuate 3,4-dioxygenase subunit alpha [Bryobacteraceae bacterium]|jgi:protocatechuate 3,4-dioxygenase alpha subunit
MITSPFCTIGPFFPFEFVDGLNDLTSLDGQTARGQHILLTGRVLEEGGAPTGNTILEIWQPDAAGILRHPLDPRFAEADPGFGGWGRARTDAQGAYTFRTVLPGATADRASHIDVMILAIGLTRRLVTTVFFGDASADPVLTCVPELSRPRLIAQRAPSLDTEGIQGYRFDLILRGGNETPFFLD